MIESICNGGIDRQELHSASWEDMTLVIMQAINVWPEQELQLRLFFQSVSEFSPSCCNLFAASNVTCLGFHLLDIGGYELPVSRYIRLEQITVYMLRDRKASASRLCSQPSKANIKTWISKVADISLMNPLYSILYKFSLHFKHVVDVSTSPHSDLTVGPNAQ